VGRQSFGGKTPSPANPVKLVWTRKSLDDIVRLHEFLAALNAAAAAKIVQGLVSTAGRLLRFPRMGERLDRYDPREVRRIFAGDYEIRYEVTQESIAILRIWHGREQS
jgi:plasmid stabilization system protein ParE